MIEQDDEVLAIVKIKKSDMKIIAEMGKEEPFLNLKLKDEEATFKPNAIINLRDSPTVNGKMIGKIYPHNEIRYDKVYINDGYIWCHSIIDNVDCYFVVGKEKNSVNVERFGTFY